MRIPGTRSFIRFRVFRKVDLPQPEGPIRAVISRSPMSSEISFSALKSPYQRFRFLAVIMGDTFSIVFLEISSCIKPLSLAYARQPP